MNELLPQFNEGGIVVRESDKISQGQNICVVHTQGFTFPFLPSEYEEAAMYFGEDCMEEDDSWIKRAKLPLPPSWSGFGYEICIFLNSSEESTWAVGFLREFCCDIISYNSDMFSKICSHYGAVLKSTVLVNEDLSEEEKNEDEEMDEEDDESIEVHLLLTKLAYFPSWKLNNVLSPASRCLVVALLITEEQYKFAQENSVYELIQTLQEKNATFISTLNK